MINPKDQYGTIHRLAPLICVETDGQKSHKTIARRSLKKSKEEEASNLSIKVFWKMQLSQKEN